MSLGTISIGLAALILVIVYLVLPFRRHKPEAETTVETWVEVASTSEGESPREGHSPIRPTAGARVEPPAPVAPVPEAGGPTCHKCGQPVQANHSFCRNCGARLTLG